MSTGFEKKHILIWGKTYPELSQQYGETVCTAGCLENGRPVRIYPVPFRLLDDYEQYRLYQWVRAPIRPSPDDPRPESYKINLNEIELGDTIETDPGWMKRRQIIEKDLSWHFDSVGDLKAAQRQSEQSLGIVPVGEVSRVYIRERSDEKEAEHAEKLTAIRAQNDLFQDHSPPHLQFQKHRIRVEWKCGTPGNIHPDCEGHDMTILDWGLGELARREGPEKAKQKIEELSDPSKYDLKFFLGNMLAYQTSFTIVGLWYPKRKDLRERSAPLFGQS
jgi:hypothetical protein